MGPAIVSVNERVAALRGQVAENTYELAAGDFVRYHSLSTDDTLAGVVRSVVAEGGGGSDAFRHCLVDQEIDTIRLFAMRRTLLGRRLSSLGPLYEAMDAFALLPREGDVPWDSWVKGTLFVARSLGADLESMGQQFADLSPGQAGRCAVAVEAMTRVSELSQCHLIEVNTTHGVGFLETLVFRGTPTFGLWGAPRQADNFVPFAPTTNLAQLCASLADALDASGTVVTGPIGQDQLAATSFSLTTAGSYVPTLGCLSFVAHDVAGSALTAFVAELPEDEEVSHDDDRYADTLAAAARQSDGQVAAADRSRLIVLSPQPSFDEELDVVIDAREFEDFARAALLEPTAL